MLDYVSSWGYSSQSWASLVLFFLSKPNPASGADICACLGPINFPPYPSQSLTCFLLWKLQLS